MNFLAPLFWLAALAVAGPIIFHLIRRTTSERRIFSSLMFLLPSPPRLTRRSRLEHILLLLLRCAVFCLLAAAFARPFFRDAAAPNPPAGPGKQIALLMDTSASMRREKLWSDALAKANEVLRAATEADQVAVFTFDRQANRVMSFEEWTSTAAGSRAELARKRLEENPPGWGSTHLGHALVGVAEQIEESTPGDKQRTPVTRRIVLISDLQDGSRLDTLQSYEWPKDIEVVVEPVKARKPTNAGLQLVAESDEVEKSDSGPRVRVSNAADSKREQFQVGWARADGKSFAGPAVDVYVPPGQSRVVAVPLLPAGVSSDRLLLRGDDEDFDNVVYSVPPEAVRVNVLYFGSDAETDTAQPLFFLKRVFQQTRRQSVTLVARPPSAPLVPGETEAASLFIITDALPEDRVAPLKRALAGGKTALVVMKDPAVAQSLARLLDLDSLPAEEAPASGYAMLGEIDFRHPLFAPFADPRFSDFTKIHFWKHRRLDAAKIPGARVVARFDNGDPAIVEISKDKGRVLVLTAGWHPADSQLALSSKFVPLLYSVLEQSGGLAPRPLQFTVGDAVPVLMPNDPTNVAVTVHKPDGSSMTPATGETSFTQTTQPGIYTVTTANSLRHFAVNLAPEESRTAPMTLDYLEKLGVPLKHREPDVATLAARQKHLLNAEIESRQKLWRWLLVASLVMLTVESWLAGWFTTRPAAQPEATR
ncbi:MAG: BatA domain-containing protein [Verrucomicrobia bacterium]|nr:BatA domain-containing protein [Verrucomicrobiota bacterium]